MTDEQTRPSNRKQPKQPKAVQRANALRHAASNIDRTLRIVEKWPSTDELDLPSVVEEIQEAKQKLLNAATDLETLPANYPPKRAGGSVAGTRGIRPGVTVRIKDKYRDRYAGMLDALDGLVVVNVVGHDIRYRGPDGRENYVQKSRVEIDKD